MNKGITKLIVSGLIITTGGVCYNLGYNNNTSPPTYKTEIVQTQDDEIKINYKDIILARYKNGADVKNCEDIFNELSNFYS